MARYVLIPKHSDKVLDVDNRAAADGARVQQWDWLGGVNQRFDIEYDSDDAFHTYYRLVAVHSGKVLEVSGNSGADGAPLLQWDWHGGDNQRWLLAGRY